MFTYSTKYNPPKNKLIKSSITNDKYHLKVKVATRMNVIVKEETKEKEEDLINIKPSQLSNNMNIS